MAHTHDEAQAIADFLMRKANEMAVLVGRHSNTAPQVFADMVLANVQSTVWELLGSLRKVYTAAAYDDEVRIPGKKEG